MEDDTAGTTVMLDDDDEPEQLGELLNGLHGFEAAATTTEDALVADTLRHEPSCCWS